MQLGDFLQKLSGVKGGGNKSQYTALCPAHDDKNPSLSIGGSGGKILLHCHAGCSKENILRAIGLDITDLYTEEKPVPFHTNGGNIKPKREITDIYNYIDLDGNIVHSSLRYNPKGFSQRRPDPDKPGEYIWKDVFKGINPVIYNLQCKQ